MFIFNGNALVLGGDDATHCWALCLLLRGSVTRLQGRIKTTVLVINGDV